MMAQPRLPDQNASSSLFLAPSRTVVTSFQPKSHTFEDGDWVLCLATCRDSPRHGEGRSIAVAVSNGEVQVYDPERLQRLSVYPTRGAAMSDASTYCVTDLLYHHTASLDDCLHNEESSTLLWATNQSGAVQLYDLRQQAPAATAQLPFSSPAWTVSIGHGGSIAAVAGNRKIHFLDVRSLTTLQQASPNDGGLQRHPSGPTPWIGCYKDAHSDHVASVRYVSNSVLLSGGEDGVVAVHNTSRPNESEALQHMWNVGSPVRKVGIMSSVAFERNELPGLPPQAVLWCLTGNETVSIWESGLDQVRDFSDLRQELNAALREDALSNGTSTIAPPAMEYLIHAYHDRQAGGLMLAAGNARGDAALFQLGRRSSDRSVPMSWIPRHILAGGHRGVVRGLQRYSESVLFSVGEDARMCEWNLHSASPLQVGGESRSPSVVGGGPVRRPRGRPNHGPY